MTEHEGVAKVTWWASLQRVKLLQGTAGLTMVPGLRRLVKKN